MRAKHARQIRRGLELARFSKGYAGYLIHTLDLADTPSATQAAFERERKRR